MVLENAELNPAAVEALMRADISLNDLYEEFRDVETDYMDILRTTVETRGETALTAEAELRVLPVYEQSMDYALDHEEMEQYRLSHNANVDCKTAIEKAIAQHYADNRLDAAAAVKEIVGVYGMERPAYVLAVTLQNMAHDGRTSRENSTWAQAVPIVRDDYNGGKDMHRDYVVEKAHPGLVDLFAGELRRQQEWQRQAPVHGKKSVLGKLKKAASNNSPKHSANFREDMR